MSNTMKGKIVVIIGFVVLLSILVYQLIQLDNSSPEVREVYPEEQVSGPPVLEAMTYEELTALSKESVSYFQTKGDYFQQLTVGYQQSNPHWETLLVKGVNLGLALPGKFPAEFALTFEQYMQWFVKIGRMNANIIRVYTILPPEFYEAFAQYNLNHQDHPLFLLHGVWAKEPPDHDYKDVAYTNEFKREIRDALDVLHGNAVLEPETGKASGVYATDVSRYLAGLVLGREWEPNGVFITNQKHQDDHYYGDFVSLVEGNAMEVWLAEIMDFTARYQTQIYKKQYPLSFVNWLPLDPMYHNTEIIENEKVREFDNDLESVHFERFNTSELFAPGLFASYHVYPYYPDYIYLKDEYAQAKNTQGRNDNYFGYLKDLKSRHEGMPLIIAEYGIPDSRGNSHQTPLGYDQGGHNELEQAEISMQLTRDIFQTGCAGAVYFEWTDEWFKHNWLVMDFEKPFHNRKLWHNIENPEQNFGILALESQKHMMDGDFSDWKGELQKSKHLSVQFDADPAYFYLASKFDQLDFRKQNLYIAIDTYSKEKGDHQLPFLDKYFDRGFEFLIEIVNPDSANIFVDEPYSVFTDIYNDHIPVYRSKKNANGLFIPQYMLTNRGRMSITGEYFDSLLLNRSPLIHGNSQKPESSNADWFWNSQTKQLEMRLTWHLLNVSDPANHYVLDDKEGTSDIEVSKTEGFNIKFFITDKKGSPLAEIPEQRYYKYLWDSWEMPTYTVKPKLLYDSLQHYFKHLNANEIVSDTPTYQGNSSSRDFRICDFYQNKEGAVSFRFLGTDYSQLQFAVPVLEKYHTKASFGVVPSFVADSPERHELDEAGMRRRFSLHEINVIHNNGHDIVLQHKSSTEPADVRPWLKKYPLSMQYGADESFDQNSLLLFNTEKVNYSVNGITFTNIDAYRHSLPSTDSVFSHNKDNWLVVNYRYFLEDTTQTRGSELFIDQKAFEWQLRLARNYDFWLAPEWDVYRYQKLKKESEIEIVQYDNTIFVSLVNQLDADIYNHPVTICFQTDAPHVKIRSDAKEYTLTNRKGHVYFNMVPNTQTTIQEIW
ncbi:MAG: hypothetical protein ACQESZ_00720 [Bacteroidota bacterium]